MTRQMIRANDIRLPALLNQQITDPSHRWTGGILDSYGIPTPNGTAKWIRDLACSWSCPESRYHRSEQVLRAMERAAEHLEREQHADGTIDLYTTNFHSPPDTAFAVEPLCMAYTLIRDASAAGRSSGKDGNAAPGSGGNALEVSGLLSLLKTFLLQAGEALVKGGIHTANHRWVVCMALARIHFLFPDPKYTDRIDDWLREGIDIDPDGQFAEKSVSIYSPLTDRCFITVARLLGRPELYEPVRRNLEMTLYYVHPDGSIATEASRRQDQYRRGSMEAYFYPYLYMAVMDGNGRFAAMAKGIWRTDGAGLTDWLAFFLEDRSLSPGLPQALSLPEDYSKVFAFSNLARIRHGDADATLLAKNPVFFTFQKGSAVLQGIRLATAFFGKGQFQGESIETENGRFVIKQSLTGPYYQPLSDEYIREDGDWNRIDRSLRGLSEIQTQESVVTISDTGKGFNIKIEIAGADNVPVAVELGFPLEGKLSGVRASADTENAFLLENGYGIYLYDGQRIRFGPGCAEHRWTQLRGALTKLSGRSVYLTGFTPLCWTLEITGTTD